jgi:hypothetical protein
MHPCHSTTTTRGNIQLCSRRACIPFLCRTLVPLLHIFVAADASLLFMTDGSGAPCNECGLRRQDSGRVEGVEGPNSSVAFPGGKSRNTSRMMNAWPSSSSSIVFHRTLVFAKLATIAIHGHRIYPLFWCRGNFNYVPPAFRPIMWHVVRYILRCRRPFVVASSLCRNIQQTWAEELEGRKPVFADLTSLSPVYRRRLQPGYHHRQHRRLLFFEGSSSPPTLSSSFYSATCSLLSVA